MIVEKFGLRGKHIAATDEHVSDLAVRRVERLLDETGRRPGRDRRGHVLRVDVEGLGGLAGRAAHRAPARLRRTRSRSSTTTSRTARRSRCGSPATCCAPSPSSANVLVVAACRESYLLDYGNERSRFMFNFGDGAVAGLLVGDARAQRGARRARDHRRLVLAAGEGRRRRLGRSGRVSLPRRREPGRR